MQELDRLDSAPSTLASIDPATGETIGSVPLAGPVEVAAAVAAAREAFPAWRGIGYHGRRAYMLALRDVFATGRDEMAQILTRENGKPLSEAMQEVFAACEFLSYYAMHAEQLLQDEPITILNPILANKETFVTYEPKGVVGVISPWNYPLLLTIAEVSGALAVGNTVVLKPSEHTPFTGLKLAEFAERAGLPRGVLQVVTGDGRTGAALSSGNVDHVCFTGSVATGKKVAKAAIENLVPSTLELGGKDPAIVLPDVDLEYTAQGLVWGAFSNSGQACASVERAYVHRSIAEPLLLKILERTGKLVVGNGLDPASEVGPMITEQQLERVDAQVQDAIAKGAKLLTGGHRLPLPGFFYAPTVLTDVTPDMRLMQEETFGPVLPLIVVENLEEAVRLANDSPFGLSASVWTRDLAQGKAIARRLRAGSVWVNTSMASYGNPRTPRGGFKESGIGKIGGRQGLLEMVDAKLIDIADQNTAKVWWYPTWGGAYDFFTAAIDLLHGHNVGRRAEGLLRFLRTKR